MESEDFLRNQDKYNINNVKSLLEEYDIQLLEDKYVDAKTKMLCLDNNGYYIYIILSNLLNRHGIGRKFDKANDYTVQNINHYLKLNNVHFKCISEKYNGANENLDFECLLCGERVSTSWKNINKNDNKNRLHIICKHCDGRTESIHALVLKQMFMHYYKDTVVEDKSFINPMTNKICPTDIVNHRLKVAVEIQSQWHDYEDIKIKDKMKKEFWVSKDYKFYAPDIRDYSILEMCQLFFNIESIPDWINYKYSNKINVKEIQKLLNNGNTVSDIAKQLNINKHRIYDAIHNKKLYYPKNYKYKNAVKKEYIL